MLLRPLRPLQPLSPLRPLSPLPRVLVETLLAPLPAPRRIRCNARFTPLLPLAFAFASAAGAASFLSIELAALAAKGPPSGETALSQASSWRPSAAPSDIESVVSAELVAVREPRSSPVNLG